MKAFRFGPVSEGRDFARASSVIASLWDNSKPTRVSELQSEIQVMFGLG
jgi:hypothetical protein